MGRGATRGKGEVTAVTAASAHSSGSGLDLSEVVVDGEIAESALIALMYFETLIIFRCWFLYSETSIFFSL